MEDLHRRIVRIQLGHKDFFSLPAEQQQQQDEKQEVKGDEDALSSEAQPDESADTWAFAWMPALEDFAPDQGEKGRGAGGKTGRYNSLLARDKSFHNPRAVDTMAAAYHICHPLSFLVDVAEDGAGEEDWFYETMRERQDRDWASNRVKQGVSLARGGKHKEALEIYDEALKLCPNHVDGLTARGAALANLGRLPAASAALEQALLIDPDNVNARSYLDATRRRMDVAERGTRAISTPSAPVQADFAGVAAAPKIILGGVKRDREAHEYEYVREEEVSSCETSSSGSLSVKRKREKSSAASSSRDTPSHRKKSKKKSKKKRSKSEKKHRKHHRRKEGGSRASSD
jgi:tetratricopeptide (TPR) repeat protein